MYCKVMISVNRIKRKFHKNLLSETIDWNSRSKWLRKSFIDRFLFHGGFGGFGGFGHMIEKIVNVVCLLGGVMLHSLKLSARSHLCWSMIIQHTTACILKCLLIYFYIIWVINYSKYMFKFRNRSECSNDIIFFLFYNKIHCTVTG